MHIHTATYMVTHAHREQSFVFFTGKDGTLSQNSKWNTANLSPVGKSLMCIKIIIEINPANYCAFNIVRLTQKQQCKRNRRSKQGECKRAYVKSFQSLSFYPIWFINLLRIFLLIMVILILISSIQRQIFSTSAYTLILARVIAWIAMCRGLKIEKKNMLAKILSKNKVLLIKKCSVNISRIP